MAPPLIQLADIGLTFGGTPLLDGAELSVSAGERICLVGRNGSGKSTLVSLLTGALAPDAGEIRLGANVQMATLDQGRESLNPNGTLSEALTGLPKTFSNDSFW